MNINKNLSKGLGIFTLAMLITGSIDSIRNLPASALFGSSLIFFTIFGAIFFLIPVALVSAELSSTHTENSGIYNWVKMAFGEKTAFIAIWLQWINTMVWYPTILSFIAGTAAFLINPQLAQNKYYLVTIILSVFWTLTFINLKGINASAKFASFCAVIGMIIPMGLIILLALIWIVFGHPLQIHLNTHTILPNLHHTQNWISLTAIMTAFLGIELSTVHVKNVHNPQKTFPKALFISVAIIIVTMILGALAIAFVIPKNQINLVDGIMQAFTNFFASYHMQWFIPVITIMILIGSLGGMVNWIISPAKGLLQAAKLGYLPKFFQKQNEHGVAHRLLITQAVLVSAICSAFLLMPSINSSYWLLTDLSTQLYIMMYVIMFVAALYMRYKFTDVNRPFKVPGGNYGMWIVCILGLIGCAITLVVGFFPPETIKIGAESHYEFIFSCGIVVMLIPALFFFGYKSIYYKKSIEHTSILK